jgi:hypothetical protein
MRLIACRRSANSRHSDPVASTRYHSLSLRHAALRLTPKPHRVGLKAKSLARSVSTANWPCSFFQWFATAALCRGGHPRLAERYGSVSERQGRLYPIDEMTLLLGVTRDTYMKYEGRGASLMPHNLIVPFCLACRVSVEWLLTGIGPTRSR